MSGSVRHGVGGGRGRVRGDGALALTVRRSGQDDRQPAHEARPDALERSRWPLASITALGCVGRGPALSAWRLTGG
ncbi:hypothetical protein [Streptomyces sp. CNQ085]|uniref:hypothetical protein n=1 Tax=Streptomyces sp. CNQ085 TaxID=2886944 RepID=UPI001F508324|nr:hypothetical protein [Streptomyces sp. CNQ085]MCI0383829.1 hypothetical protein [Streptomyces sp. CNQ085]